MADNFGRIKGSVFLVSKKTALSGLAVLVAMAPMTVFAPQIAHAAADTCTWDGSSSADWSDGANWTGCDNGGVPEDGDGLVFPEVAANKASSNNITGLDAEFIEIEGDNYSLAGNDLELSPAGATALYMYGNLNEIELNTTVTGASSKAIDSSGSDNEISGNVVLNLSGGGDMNFSTGSVSNALEISGVISGTNEIFVVSPDSRLFLSNTNTFDKLAVAINDSSILDCGANECLGNFDLGDEINIYGGGQLYLDNNITLEEEINFLNGTNSPGQVWAALDSTLSGNINASGAGIVGVQNTTVLTVNGDIQIYNTGSIQFQGNEGYADNVVDINGELLDEGPLYLTDVDATLNAASTSYIGTVNVEAGALLRLGDNDALGSDTVGTTIADGGTLFTDTFLTIPEPITITGDGIQSGGYNGAIVGDTTVHVFSDIILDGDATVMNWSDSMTLSLRGVISGDGDLTLAGYNIDNAPIEIGGHGGSPDASPSTYTGHTYVNNARLFMHKNTGVNSVPGDVTVTAGTYAASLWTQSEEQIPDNATVTLDDAGISTAVLVVTGGVTETVGTVEGDGVIQLGSASDHLQVGGGDKSGTFTGQILSANGPITKVGNGTWNFQGSNWDLGSGFADFEISDGTLLANAADTSLANSSFDLSGGNLGGDGVLGPITANAGSVAPGNSPGCLNPDGDVTFLSTASFDVQLAGTTVCTEYDKLVATGTITLGGATLNTSLSFASTIGNSFTIIEGTSVTGTFASLDDNETFVLGTRTFKIDYTPTTVVLTDVGAAPSTGSGSLGTTGQALSTLLLGGITASSGFGIALLRRRRFAQYRHQ